MRTTTEEVRLDQGKLPGSGTVRPTSYRFSRPRHPSRLKFLASPDRSGRNLHLQLGNPRNVGLKERECRPLTLCGFLSNDIDSLLKFRGRAWGLGNKIMFVDGRNLNGAEI